MASSSAANQDPFAAIQTWATAHAEDNRRLPGKARGAVRVLPGLYLGNRRSAADKETLDNLNISAVCSVGPKSEHVVSDGRRLLKVSLLASLIPIQQKNLLHKKADKAYIETFTLLV